MEKFILPEPLNEDNLPQEPEKKTTGATERFVLPESSDKPFMPSQLMTGNKIETKYDPNRPLTVSQDEWRAVQQSRWEKWLYAPFRLIGGVSSTLTDFAGQVGAIAEFTGDIRSGGIHIKDYMDNSLIEAAEVMKEETDKLFPIYVPDAVKNGDIMDNITSASFYTKEGVDAAAFFVSNYFLGLGMAKAVSRAARIASKYNLPKSIVTGVGQLTTSAVQSNYEALFESQDLVKQLKPELDAQIEAGIIDEQEADRRLREAFNNSYTTNLAILLPSNLLMNKMLLGRYFNENKVLGKVFDKTTGTYVAPTKWGAKTIAKNFLVNTGKAFGTEGLWEEGGQGVSTRLNEELALSGVSLDPWQYVKGMGAGWFSLLGDTEQQKAIYLGGLLGLFGSVGQTRRDYVMQNKTLPKLAELMFNHADDFNKSLSGIVKPDPNDPTSGNTTLDHTVIGDYLFSDIRTGVEASMLTSAAVSGNNEVFDYLYNRIFTKFALPHFKYEDGINTLIKYIEGNAQHLISEYNKIGEEGKIQDENVFTQKLKDKAKALKKSYDKYSDIIDRVTFPKKASPELVGAYKESLLFNLTAEESYQDFLKEQIENTKNSLTPYVEKLADQAFGLTIDETLDIINKPEKLLDNKRVIDSGNFTKSDLTYIDSLRDAIKTFEAALKESKSKIDSIFDKEQVAKDLLRFTAERAVQDLTKHLENAAKNVDSAEAQAAKAKLVTGTKFDSLDLVNSYKAWSQTGDYTDAEAYKNALMEAINVLKTQDSALFSDNYLKNIIEQTPILDNLSTQSSKSDVLRALKAFLNIETSSASAIEDSEDPSIDDLFGTGMPDDIDQDFDDLIRAAEDEIRGRAASTTGETPPPSTTPTTTQTYKNPNSKFREENEFTTLIPPKDFNGKYDRALIDRLAVSDPDFTDKLEVVIKRNTSNNIGEYRYGDPSLHITGGKLTIEIVYKSGKADIGDMVVGYLPSANQYLDVNKKIIDVQNLTREQIGELFKPTDVDTMNISLFKENHKKLLELENRLLQKFDSVLVNDQSAISTLEDLGLSADVSTGHYTVITPSEPLTPGKNFEKLTKIPGYSDTPLIVALQPQYQTDEDGGIERLIGYGVPTAYNEKAFLENGRKPEWLNRGLTTLQTAADNHRNNTGGRVSSYAVLVRDPGGPVKVDGKDFSWIFLHPNHLTDTERQEFLDTLLDGREKLLELVGKESFLKELSTFNKDLMGDYYIPDVPGISVSMGLTRAGSSEDINIFLQYYNDTTKSKNTYYVSLSEIIRDGKFEFSNFINAINSKIDNEAHKLYGEGYARTIRRNPPKPNVVATVEADLTSFGSMSRPQIKKDKHLDINVVTPAPSSVSSAPTSTVVEPGPSPQASPISNDALIVRFTELKAKLSSGVATIDELKEFQTVQSELAKLYPDTLPFKISKSVGTMSLDLDRVREELGDILPSWITIEEFTTLLDNLKTDGVVLGEFVNDVIKLNKATSPGTEYHEAFHAVFRRLLSPDEVAQLRQIGRTMLVKRLKNSKEFSSLHSAAEYFRRQHPSRTHLSQVDLLNLMYEEELADDYQKHKLTKKEPTSLLKKFYNKLKHFFDWLTSQDYRVLHGVYNKMDTGYYRNSSPIDNKVNLKIPAYALLPVGIRVTADGKVEQATENVDETERKINTIAALIVKKVNYNTSKSKRLNSAFNDIIAEKAVEFSIDNPIYADRLAEKAEAYGKSLAEYILEQHYTFTDPTAVEILREMVMRKLNEFNISDLEDILSDELDDINSDLTPERRHDMSQENRGGVKNLDIKIRQYIGLTLHDTTDNFGFTRQLSVDVGTVYESITKAAINSLSYDEIIHKLYGLKLLDSTTEAAAFVDKFFSDIKLNVDTLKSTGEVIYDDRATPLALSVLKSINLFSASYRSVGVDFKNKSFRVGTQSNQGLSMNQIAKWAYDSKSKFLNKTAAERRELLEGLRDAVRYDIAGEYALTSTNLPQLITDIKNSFNGVGIDLSSGYIKYLLMSSPGRVEKLSIEEANAVYRLQPNLGLNHAQFIDNMNEVINIFMSGKNPLERAYRYEQLKGKKVVKDASEDALSRLMKIAKDNAMFDQRVKTTTFSTTDGKPIYWAQEGSFHMIHFLRLKKEAGYFESLANSPIYGEYLKTNYLWTNQDFQDILPIIENIERNAGIYDTTSPGAQANKQEGASYGSLEGRDFMLVQLGYFLDRKTHTVVNPDGSKKTIQYYPMQLDIMSTSSTGDILQVPIVKDTITEDGITDAYKELFFNEVVREYNRIRHVESAPIEAHKPDYHIGKKRGHDFWITKKLLQGNKELYEKLKSGETTPQQEKSAIIKLIDKHLNTLLNGYINDLIESRILYKDPDGALKNALLDSRYLGLGEGDAKIFDSKDLKVNLSKAFLTNYINNIAANQLMKGDPATGASTPEQYVKRNKHGNIAGRNLKSSMDDSMKFYTIEEPIDEQGIKVADGQVFGSVKFYRSYFNALGILTPEVNGVLDIIKEGRRDLTLKELKTLSDADAMLNAKKPAAATIDVQLKCSVASVDRNTVGFYIGDEFLPRPGYEDLYKMVLNLENSGAHFAATPTSMKRLQDSPHKHSEDISSDMLSEIPTNYFVEQQRNPSGKLQITDPTQKHRLILSNITSPTGKRLAAKYEETLNKITGRIFSNLNNLIADFSSGKVDMEFFKTQAIKILESSGASDNLMAFFSPNNVHNLNNPATLDKFIQLFTAYYKSAFKLTLPGYKTTLRSDFGVSLLETLDGKIITRDVFDSNPQHYYNLYTSGQLVTRKLREDVVGKDGVIYSECILPKHFAEQFSLRPGDVIPESMANLMGARIPGTGKHSMSPLRMVDTFPSYHGSNIILPAKLIERIGHDFDVDAFYVRRPAHYTVYSGTGYPIIRKYGNTDSDSPYKQYLNWLLEYEPFLEKYNYNLKKFATKEQIVNEAMAMFKQHLTNLGIHNVKLEEVKKGSNVSKILKTFDGENVPIFIKKIIYGKAHQYSRGIEDVDVSDFLETALSDITFDKDSIFTHTLKEMRLPTSQEAYNKYRDRYGDPNLNVVYNELLDLERQLWSLDDADVVAARTANESDKMFKESAIDLAEKILPSEVVSEVPRDELFEHLQGYRDPFTMNGLQVAFSQNMAAVKAVGSAVNISQTYILLHREDIQPHVDITKNEEGETVKEPRNFNLEIIDRAGNAVALNDFSSSFTKLPDVSGSKERISLNLGAGITATVDAGTINYPGFLNLDINQLGTASYLETRGMPLFMAIQFANMPSVREYASLRKSGNIKTEFELRYASDVQAFEYILSNYRSKINEFTKDNEGIEFDFGTLFDGKIRQEDIESTLMERGILPQHDKMAAFRHLVTNFKVLYAWRGASLEAKELSHLSRIMKLGKGIEGIQEFTSNIEDSLDVLGYRYDINASGDVKIVKVDNPSSIYNYDPIILKNPRIVGLLENLGKFMSRQKEEMFFRSPLFRNIRSLGTKSLRDRVKNKTRILKEFDRNLNSYLIIKAYKKHLSDKQLLGDLDQLKLGTVFKHVNPEGKLDAIQLLDKHLKEDPNLANNAFIKALSLSTSGEVSRIYHDTRTKGRASTFTRKQTDDYTALYRNVNTRPLAKALFNYLVMTDGLQFRNNSFIQLIPPFVFSELSESMNNMADLLQTDKEEDYSNVFGASKETLMEEFFDLYFSFVKYRLYVKNTRTKKSLKKLLAPILSTSDGGKYTFDIALGVPNFNLNQTMTFTSSTLMEEVKLDEKELEDSEKKRKLNLKTIYDSGVFDVVETSKEAKKGDRNKPFLSIVGPLYFYSNRVIDETRVYNIFKLVEVDGKPVKLSDLESGVVPGAKLTYVPIQFIGQHDHPWIPIASTREEAKLVSSKQVSTKFIKPAKRSIEDIQPGEESTPSDAPSFEDMYGTFDPSADYATQSIDDLTSETADNEDSDEVSSKPPKPGSALQTPPTPSAIPGEPAIEPGDFGNDTPDAAMLSEAPTIKNNPKNVIGHSSQFVKEDSGMYFNLETKEVISEETYNKLIELQQAQNDKTKDCNGL